MVVILVLRGQTSRAFWFTDFLAWAIILKLGCKTPTWQCTRSEEKCQIIFAVWHISTIVKGLDNSSVLLSKSPPSTLNLHERSENLKNWENSTNLGSRKPTLKSICANIQRGDPQFLLISLSMLALCGAEDQWPSWFTFTNRFETLSYKSASGSSAEEVWPSYIGNFLQNAEKSDSFVCVFSNAFTIVHLRI